MYHITFIKIKMHTYPYNTMQNKILTQQIILVNVFVRFFMLASNGIDRTRQGTVVCVELG
jgi:hypothetical protein